MTAQLAGNGDAAADRHADGLVLFGATGDLAHRKLFAALQAMAQHDSLPAVVVGVASSDWTTEQLIARARDGIESHGGGVDETAFSLLAKRLTYLRGDLQQPETFPALARELASRRVNKAAHYLAIPPSLFGAVVEGLRHANLHRHGRVIIEKPFGHDLASAVELNSVIHAGFPESEVFRIDHYLGKEAVQNIVYFRFANAILEPLWNRNYVDSVVVTMAEDIGVDGRGRFYDGVGALRDVVQNHLFQIVALLAMEAPRSHDSEAIRDEMVSVFRSMRPIDPRDYVRGQYQGYRDVEGVAVDSDVETFAGVRVFVDSWRWAGVPFVVRAGKRLARSGSEVRIRFHRPPVSIFDDPTAANELRYVMSPDVGVRVTLVSKTAGEAFVGHPVQLEVSSPASGMSPYERLLGDALEGDATLFARQDGVEATWRVVAPILGSPHPTVSYTPGSWGPEIADSLDPGPWHLDV